MKPKDDTPQIGRYRLLGEIAEGGMARVYLGVMVGPQRFARRVAIKRLHAGYARSPEFLAMFFEEARLAARVQHPHVVSVIDFVNEGDEALLVMDHVAGLSLASVLSALAEQRQRMPLPVVARIGHDLLAGLHAAHTARDERGQPLHIVHRDVSPQNVLVGEDGLSRVVDFGIARAAGRLQTTREGQLKGKLAYMAKEQLQSQPVDARADIYAAAIVMWEMVTGARLFEGEDEVATFRLALEAKVPPAGERRRDFPPAAEEVLLRALQTEREARFVTAADMARALAAAIAPASHAQVATWLRTAVGERLARQAALVAELERAAGPLTRGASPATTASGVVAKAEEWASRTAAEAPTRAPSRGGISNDKPRDAGHARGRLAAMAAGLLLALGAAVASWPRQGTPPATPPAPTSTAAPAPLSADARAPDGKVEASPPAHVAVPSSPSSARRVSAPARGKNKRAAPAECTPPFTVDAEGVRIPKPQCL